MSNYSEFFILIKQIGQPKEAMISNFTEGRTESLRALSQKEYNALCASMRRSIAGDKTYVPKDNPKGDALRKGIISCFHTMNYTHPAQEAKDWAEKMGVGTGSDNVKRKFNHYSNQELMSLMTKANQAVVDYLAALRNRFK